MDQRLTECVLGVNGISNASETIIKYHTDKHDSNLAIKLVTKKVLKNIENRELRKEIWKVVLDATSGEYKDINIFENETKEYIKYNDSDEWFINNFVGLSKMELALVRKGKIEKVDRKKLLNWYIENM